MCLHVYSVPFEKIDIFALRVLNTVNFGFIEMLDVGQIEVWFLEVYVPPPLTCSWNLRASCFPDSRLFWGGPFLPQLFLPSVSRLLGVWIWDIQMFLLLLKVTKQKTFHTSPNSCTESLEKRGGESNMLSPSPSDACPCVGTRHGKEGQCSAPFSAHLSLGFP